MIISSPASGLSVQQPDEKTSQKKENLVREPPTTKSIITDSEEDPEYNQEEFLRLRTSLHRRIDEAEARDRADLRSKRTCSRKLRRFFRRMFVFDGKRSQNKAKSKNTSITSSALAKLKCPPSPNTKLGEANVSSSEVSDEDD